MSYMGIDAYSTKEFWLKYGHDETCVTSVRCNIVRIALASIHVPMSRCFNSAIVSCCAHKLLILIVLSGQLNRKKHMCR